MDTSSETGYEIIEYHRPTGRFQVFGKNGCPRVTCRLMEDYICGCRYSVGTAALFLQHLQRCQPGLPSRVLTLIKSFATMESEYVPHLGG